MSAPRPEPRREPNVAERRIARMLAKGEPEASALILDAYGSVLRGFIAQVLGGERGMTEDVLQQVLLQVWQRGASFDAARGSLLNWLLMIARSRALDALRKHVPEPRDPAAAAREVDQATQQEDHVDRLMAQWRLRHLLGVLTPESATLLRMRFELDLSQSEIARQTGIPLGTVKARMAGAMRRLRELMDDA